jgi:AraC-like DNA-binding protein
VLPRQQITSRTSTLTSYSQAVEQVIRIMRAQLSEPLSLEEMGEIVYMSPFHFNRVFRSIVGIPPGEFLAALRLNAAKRLLLTTSLSVTDVCFDLGYTSLGTFTERFKHLIGLSPLQLRHLAQNSAMSPLKTLDERSRQAQRLVVSTLGLSGVISVPGPFSGLIFVGLFPKPIPQHRPIACTTLAAPGPYQIALIPDGSYYVLSAALPRSQSVLTYLLPESGVLVGVSDQSVLVRGGRASVSVDLRLRPLTPTDPPILGVFPPLLGISPPLQQLGVTSGAIAQSAR